MEILIFFFLLPFSVLGIYMGKILSIIIFIIINNYKLNKKNIFRLWKHF